MSESSRAIVDRLQPVVLVGGSSVRFGRDKLLEPWDGGVLVERPIAALRAVFGSRVMTVGACDPHVAALADGVIPDAHPGAGPIGGIISALRACDGGVFVLAGDMPGFGPDEVRAILRAAEQRHGAMAVLALSDRVQPCAGVYFPGALEMLSTRLASGSSRLHDAIAPDDRVEVALPESALRNVNRPE